MKASGMSVIRASLALVFILSMYPGYSQEQDIQPVDSLMSAELQEIIVVGQKSLNHHRQIKPLSSADEYLERATRVGMIRRGAYAWEPMVNSMSMERLAVTIDGMHIFGACTDKMDPITSYVDISNLSEINIYSGQQGPGFGPAIGGAINLSRNRPDYRKTGWGGGIDAGLESNSLLQTYGADLNYSDKNFYVNADFMYRDAGNYKAGDRKEILYSQFTKYNFSTTAGGKWKDNNFLEASLIYDRAVDVGYPALPMDVSLARAIISSLRYQKLNLTPRIHGWDTKVYFNTVTHQMDDSKRPDVPIRMDMPGWSTTYGLYSRLTGILNSHRWKMTASAYHNVALAEMTMFPNDPSSSEMFMYTWPDVRTSYAGLHFEDQVNLNEQHAFRFSFATGLHRNFVAKEFGLNSLQIFYPDMLASRSRMVSSLSAGYTTTWKDWEWSASAGYGERAASISEGYGFYLFNSFDGFDYIGNPLLPNERALEWHTHLQWRKGSFKTKLSGSYFYFLQYLIGVPEEDLSPMTIGARGVKIYQAQQGAGMFNADWTTSYLYKDVLKVHAQLSYHYGRDAFGRPLPLIRPFSYFGTLAYRKGAFDAELSVAGDIKQRAFSAFYGESLSEGFAVLNFASGYQFKFAGNTLHLKAGIENIFDHQYSTFSDWNNLLRKGRNFFINLSFSFDKKDCH
jgi:iron complex outermembrane recepter protein